MINLNNIKDKIKILNYIEFKQPDNKKIITYIKNNINIHLNNEPITELYFNYDYEYYNKYDKLLYCILKSLSC